MMATHPTVMKGDQSIANYKDSKSASDMTPSKKGGSEWYQPAVQADGKIIRTAPYVDTTNSMIVSNSRTVKDSTGKLVGVVGIDVEHSNISDLLNDMKLGETGYFMLIHNTGIIIANGMHAGNLVRLKEEIGQTDFSQAIN